MFFNSSSSPPVISFSSPVIFFCFSLSYRSSCFLPWLLYRLHHPLAHLFLLSLVLSDSLASLLASAASFLFFTITILMSFFFRCLSLAVCHLFLPFACRLFLPIFLTASFWAMPAFITCAFVTSPPSFLLPYPWSPPLFFLSLPVPPSLLLPYRWSCPFPFFFFLYSFLLLLLLPLHVVYTFYF